MNPEKILARAEAFKRKSHRLSIDLRLKSVGEAKKFLREHSVVLWNDKGDLPNLLDATIGRIANGKERVRGKAAENCSLLRKQVLQDPEFLECRFFCKQATALHEDLWPYATVIARANRARVEDGAAASREARKIIAFLSKEGPSSPGRIRQALKLTASPEARLFQRAKQELQQLLILLEQEKAAGNNPPSGQLELWETRMPRPVKSRADQISDKEASLYLMAATLDSCVLSNEKNMSRWFAWFDHSFHELIDPLIQKKDFMTVDYRKTRYIIPRKVVK